MVIENRQQLRVIKTQKNENDFIESNEKGEDEDMRFNNCTIRRAKGCKTWYTRKRIDGKQIYITAPTQQGVRERLKELINFTPKKKASGMTLHQWYNRWLELFKVGKVKQATLTDYEKTLKHISSDIWEQSIKTITSIQIIEMLKNIEYERTRQKVYELLNALFEKAVAHDLIKKNIMVLVDKPAHIREQGIALNFEQQQKLINACNKYKQTGDLYLVCLYQGLRIGEALGLTVTDLDFSNKTISINKSYNKSGKMDTTKNKQSIRIVPMFDNTIPILQKYLKAKYRIFDFSYNTSTKYLHKLTKEIGLPNISLHDLRHTFITNCKNAGIPEHILQAWVGHQIGSTVTKTVYTHVTEDANLSNIDKLNHSKYYSLTTHKK